MRKRLVAALAIFLILSVTQSIGAQSRSVYWERWDVLIDNLDITANRFDVTESYEVRFSGRFTFGSAVIPYENLEDVRNLQVSENGRPLEPGCSQSPGTFCAVRNDQEIEVAYYFNQPIINDRANFTIRYTVVGALRIYPEGDQLWWTGVPSEHYSFTIGSSTITVQMPPGFTPREGIDPVETYGVPAEVNVTGTTITARATEPISGDEKFEIRVQYPHNPAARVASWQANFDQRRQYEETTQPIINLGLIALSVLIAIGGLIGVYALWYTRGRDPQVGPVPEFLSEPPSELPPAVVGTLLDEKADLRDVISTVVDLARRGYLVMEEDQIEGLFGIRSSRFVFKRTDKSFDDLRPFEQRLMKALFSGNRMERTLDSLKNSFYAVIPQLQSDLYETMVEEGLFTTRPNTTRALWSGLGTVLFVLAFLTAFGAFTVLESVSSFLLCLPMALGSVGVTAMVAGQFMPAKTRKGAEDAAKWRAFREYLHNLEKYADIETAAGQFDSYLPYAIAFGLDRSWIRRFSQLQTVPIPPWYFPTYMGGPYRGGYRPGTPVGNWGGRDLYAGELARAGEGGLSMDDLSSNLSKGLESISSGLTQMLDSAGRAMTSQPQQSGSSGRWSSGGRGWSGGGFRGGGSSGGGSRGFG